MMSKRATYQSLCSVQLTTMINVGTVKPFCDHGLHGVAVPSHPPHQRRPSLAHYCIETIYARFGKCLKCTAIAREQKNCGQLVLININNILIICFK